MKNYYAIIPIMAVLLVPLNVNALTPETLQLWLSEIDANEMTLIKDDNQPHASAYITIRDSDGSLVGVSHVTATSYLEHPLFYEFVEKSASKNVVFEGTQYQMLDLIITDEFIDADCNNAAQKRMGYGTINDVCFFYSFSSDLSTTWGVTNLENTVDYHDVTMFSGLQHGFIIEEGDTVSMGWTTLIPIN